MILVCTKDVYPQQQMGSFMAYGPETKYFSNLNYRVYQSKNGYLWFGTLNGLVRFDGKRYKNYFANYADPNSPADNTIFDIAEDKNGDLWFAGFYHGATRYNQRTGKFTKYPVLSKDNYPYYGVYRILNDAEGNLWFATAGRGLAKYDFEKDNFMFYYPEPDKPKDGSDRGYNYVTDIAEDKTEKNILWIAGFHGLYSFDKKVGKFIGFYPGNLPGQPGMTFNDLELDNDGLLWAGTWGYGLNCFDTKTKKFIRSREKQFADIVYDLELINDSTLYAACLNQGLFQFNTKTGEYSNITPPRNPADPTAQQPDIQKISLTPDAGIFIGGNYYVYQQHPDFIRLKNKVNYPIAEKLTDIGLNSCVWDEKRQIYWLATTTGLYELDKNMQQIKLLPVERAAGLPDNYYDLVIDPLYRIWVLNTNEGIYQWNEQKKMFAKPTDKIPLPDSLLLKIYKLKTDGTGNIWMIAGNNFICWDTKKNKTEVFAISWDSNYKGAHLVGNNELQVDPEGNAWWFTQSGLFNCRRQEKKVNHIFKTGSSEDDLASRVVIGGAFDKYYGLWITSGNGIQVIDRKNYTLLATHDIAGGLPSMSVNSIVSDAAGRIWAGSASGLALFDPPKKTWQLFNRFDGLERDYLDGGLTITSNNKIVIEQVDGFLIKDINELLSRGQPPILRITSIIINKDEYNDSLLPEFIPELVLPYNQNNIDIEYAAMDWVYPLKTTYQYTIEGVSAASTWMPDLDCKINLTGLQPGKYTIHIKALSGSGVWSKEVILPITIRPPFWKTAWFIILVILAIAMIAISLYRYRIKQLKRLMEMRNDISRNLHDDIGASLSNINILNELAKRNIEQDDQKAKEYLLRSGEDIQRISESLGDIVWNINPRYDDIENLFIRMKRYAADMMEGKKITPRLEFPVASDKFSMPMDQRRDLYLIFKEAVNNLVKYSKATEATVAIELKGRNIILRVEDNGCGFDTAVSASGNGLNNIRTRAEKWGALLEITSVPGKGTKLNLEMKTS